MIDNQNGRRNLTDGWKFQLSQAKKEILLEVGKESMSEGGKGLSTIDKPSHNTQKTIANDLGWSTGKVAMADKVWKEATPEIKEQVLAGDVSINEAYKGIKKAERVIDIEKQREDIANNVMAKIDGHNRYEICTKHGLEFSVVEKDFTNENHAKEWMINNQFGRRNLSNYQRSVLALELEGVFSDRAKEKQREAGGAVRQISDKAVIDTKKELSKVANVSHDTIAKVKKIQSTATPEVKAQLNNGEISINEAYKGIKKAERAIDIEKQREDIANNVMAKIDGHNRYEICTKHGLEFSVVEKDFTNENHAKEWMINNQNGRRNLSNYQRSVLALELEGVFSDMAKENQAIQFKGNSLKQKSAEVKPIETRSELAKIANVSHDTIANDL